MAAIKFLNMGEAMQKMTRSVDAIQKAQKTAAVQMGMIAKQNIQNQTPHPMHVLSSHWQKSWNFQVERISDLKLRLTVFSNGAERYYYIQEALHHPGEIGMHRSKPEMDDIYQRVITSGLLGKSITGRVSSSNIDEFGMMAGF